MISGKLLTILLTWLLLSPAFRLRKFSQGGKQGLASPGGISLTLSYFFGLMRNVTLSVALGYYSVYLTTTPLLVASSIIFLAKSSVDKEFRRWRLGPKLTHCLISAIFPITTPRPESKEDDKEEKSASRITTKVKVAGNELFFCHNEKSLCVPSAKYISYM